MLLISLSGTDLMTSFSCAASCVANVGPGFGLVGPTLNYSLLTPVTKLICTFLMISGRLELYSVFVLFSKYYWNPHRG